MTVRPLKFSEVQLRSPLLLVVPCEQNENDRGNLIPNSIIMTAVMKAMDIFCGCIFYYVLDMLIVSLIERLVTGQIEKKEHSI